MAKDPVVVIGGGVVGLCTAHFLRREGAEVVVVEGRHLGAGASSGNGGWIVPSLSAPLAGPGMIRAGVASLLRRNGAMRVRHTAPGVLPWLRRFARYCNAADHMRGLRATASLAARAIDCYQRLADDGVRFDMTSPGLLTAFRDEGPARASAAGLAAMAEFGYDQPVLLDGPEACRLEPALDPSVAAAYLLSGERVVEPTSLLVGLRDRLATDGVDIREAWPVERFDLRAGRVAAIHGRAGTIRPSEVVIAAGAWSDQLARRLGTRLWLQAGKGYSFSIRTDVPVTRPLYLPESKLGFTPFGEKVRVVGNLDLSGLDTRLQNGRIEALSRAARHYVSGWSPTERTEEWCGLRSVTPDGLPSIGRLPTIDNVTVGAGHGLLGVTLAVASGSVMADIALRRTPSLAPVLAFRPERFDRRARQVPRSSSANPTPIAAALPSPTRR